MGLMDQLSISSLFKDVQRMDKRQVNSMRQTIEVINVYYAFGLS